MPLLAGVMQLVTLMHGSSNGEGSIRADGGFQRVGRIPPSVATGVTKSISYWYGKNTRSIRSLENFPHATCFNGRTGRERVSWVVRSLCKDEGIVRDI